MDGFNLEALAKEIAVERLKTAEDAPLAAGDLAKELVIKSVTGTMNKQEPRYAVTAVCRGLMEGVILLEKDVPKTAVALISQIGTIAQETALDPAELMTWAMEGFAPVCRLAGNAAFSSTQDAIDAAFMGAGEVFLRAADPGS
jgi:hypothetical protein